MFSSKLRDIANEVFQLGEIYSKEKSVRKTLRSLLTRFGTNVDAIEEAKDIATMILDDLMH